MRRYVLKCCICDLKVSALKICLNSDATFVYALSSIHKKHTDFTQWFYMYVYVCMYVCKYVCMFVHVFMYIVISRKKSTDFPLGKTACMCMHS